MVEESSIQTEMNTGTDTCKEALHVTLRSINTEVVFLTEHLTLHKGKDEKYLRGSAEQILVGVVFCSMFFYVFSFINDSVIQV